MELDREGLDPHYQAVLARCSSYLLSYLDNWPALELSPFGFEVLPQNRYSVTSLRSGPIVSALHRLQTLVYAAGQQRSPPRVLFCAGGFPGIVFGFGRRATEVPVRVRKLFELGGDPDSLVPLSMWVAIRCAESGAWFAQDLASANTVLRGASRLPGLGTLTSVLGAQVACARILYGSLRWDSPSIGLHLRFGPMELLSAQTPTLGEAEVFTFRLEIDPMRQAAVLRSGWQSPVREFERTVGADDHDAILALQTEIEQGARWQLVGVERPRRKPQRLRLCQPG